MRCEGLWDDMTAEDTARLDRIVDFFNEVGMLRHTPRSGLPSSLCLVLFQTSLTAR